MGKILKEENDNFSIKVRVADTFLRRLKGLMFDKSLSLDQAVIFMNCSSIHTCFMKFDIDVVYLNKEYEIVGIETIKPFKMGKFFKGTKIIVEMNEGIASKLCVGDKLSLLDI